MSGTPWFWTANRAAPNAKFASVPGLIARPADRGGIFPAQCLPKIAQRMVVQRNQLARGIKPMAGDELGQLNQFFDRFLRLGDFEDAHGAIASGGDNFTLVRTEARSHDLTILLQWECERLTRGRIPQPRLKIPAGHQQAP